MQTLSSPNTEFKETFFPSAIEAARRLQDQQTKLAYYTTADTACKMIRNGEVWLRNATVMNDYSELTHGLACLRDAYNSSPGEALKDVLNTIHPGISQELEVDFNRWIPSIQYSTFIACLTEHPPEEDQFGRLSMWRAYGGSSGVAVIVKPDPFLSPMPALAAYSSPVEYLNNSEFADRLLSVSQRLATKSEFLHSIGRGTTKSALLHMFRFGAVCTKHPAFREEREWRIVATPALESSIHLPQLIETIGGVPQPVLKLRLQNSADEGISGLEINEVLERVLVGPCEHRPVIGAALLSAMTHAEVSAPSTKIWHTGIPLRAPNR